MNMFIKTIKKHPILLILVVSFFVYLGLMLPKTKGPSIIIETAQPSEDYVIRCDWYSSRFSISGGRKFVTDKIAVIKSGEIFDCGYSISGALMEAQPSVSIMHPVHVIDREKNYEKDGVEHIVLNKTKLDLLDEQKAKFEAGYWDKHRNPGRSYLSSLPGCSGLPPQYLEHYSEVRKIDVEVFKRKYNDKIFECVRKEYEEILKHDPYSSKQLPTPEKSMGMLWDPILWRKYE